MRLKRNNTGGWRDGSAVKSTVCSSRGPEFNSQQPYSGLQPSHMRSDSRLGGYVKTHMRKIKCINEYF